MMESVKLVGDGHWIQPRPSYLDEIWAAGMNCRRAWRGLLDQRVQNAIFIDQAGLKYSLHSGRTCRRRGSENLSEMLWQFVFGVLKGNVFGMRLHGRVRFLQLGFREGQAGDKKVFYREFREFETDMMGDDYHEFKISQLMFFMTIDDLVQNANDIFMSLYYLPNEAFGYCKGGLGDNN